MFSVLVDRRDASTLISIICQYLLPGATIYSDQWCAYSAINDDNDGPERCIHQTVSHLINFVDPTTLVHRQNIENIWMVEKMKKKNQLSQHRLLLDTYLIEFMWRRKGVGWIRPFFHPQ